ncbi:MAG: FkbM family methyltransferase [Hansschlegelia sp.]
MTTLNNNDKICVVAIAKNEERFLEEWISHYLSLGVDAIHIYDNESDDKTAEMIKAIGERFPVFYKYWENPVSQSPQITAYNDFLQNSSSEYKWVGYFDLDEFLVIKTGQKSIHDVLNGLPDDVSAVAVNWLTFGTSDVETRDYSLVRSTFRYGPSRSFGNNHHFKSFIRPDRMETMRIHHGQVKSGSYVHPNGAPIEMPKKAGLSALIEHSVLQLNHYQTKSREDFWAKIQKGRVCKRVGDPLKTRENPEEMLAKLDRMDEKYTEIDFNEAEFLAYMEKVSGKPVDASGAAPKPELKDELLVTNVNGLDIYYRDNATDLRVIKSSMMRGEFDIIQRLVTSTPNKFIIDAGGYIGTASIMLAQMFPDSVIVCVEPSSSNYAVMKQNVRRFPNVIPLNAALVGVSRDLHLFDRRTGPWGFTVVEKPTDKATVDTIETVKGLTVPEIMERFGAKGVDVLKVDIEGGELELFQNSSEWVDRVGAILVELHDRIVPGCTEVFDKKTAGMKPMLTRGEKRFTYNENYFGVSGQTAEAIAV